MTTRTIVSLSLLAVVSGANATVAPDPWTRIPAPPDGCYREDDYETRLYDVRVAIGTDESNQRQINEGISRRISEEGPNLAAKMQEYMMAHPQEAMQLMQASQTAGDAVNGAFEASQAQRKALLDERAAIDARYKADLARMNAPIEKKLKDLDARAEMVVVGEGYAYSPKSAKEYNLIQTEGDAAYEKLSAAYWTGTGAYPEWLKRWKAYLVEQIPREEAAETSGNMLMIKMLETPDVKFRPTSSFSYARQYVEEADKIYRGREWRRRPKMEGAAP